MATTCAYHDPTTKQYECSDPATHVAVSALRTPDVWNVVVASGKQVPQFCLRHAGDVSQQRQTQWKNHSRTMRAS